MVTKHGGYLPPVSKESPGDLPWIPWSAYKVFRQQESTDMTRVTISLTCPSIANISLPFLPEIYPPSLAEAITSISYLTHSISRKPFKDSMTSNQSFSWLLCWDGLPIIINGALWLKAATSSTRDSLQNQYKAIKTITWTSSKIGHQHPSPSSIR